ncbi:MAG: phage tail protein [Rhizomicrobium sp.]
MQLCSLGMFIFAIDTLAYNELQRRTSWRHARSTRVGARDATQFVGPGDETINLSGTVYAEICDGRASLDDLRDMAAAGDAYLLITGDGSVVGSFVIEGIDERHAALMEDGSPRAIDFAIDLLRVDDEDASDTSEAAA